MTRIPCVPTYAPIRSFNFKQHSSDFASHIREQSLNQWEQTFAQHLFLLARWRLSQHACGQRLLTLDKYSCLGWLGLLLLLLLGRHHLGLGCATKVGLHVPLALLGPTGY